MTLRFEARHTPALVQPTWNRVHYDQKLLILLLTSNLVCLEFPRQWSPATISHLE